MAETDRAFITRIDDQFKKVSSKVDKISALIKGRDKSGIPIPSPLFNAIYNIEKNRTSLEAEVEDIKNVHPQNQPIDKDRKRKVDDELKMFKRNVMNMKEGLDFALDARSPSPFAWVVFSAGTAVLIGVLIYYISLHTNRPASARLQGISDEQRLNAIDAIASIRVRAALLEELLARESVFKNEEDKKAMTSLRENIHKTLRDTVDTLKVMTSLSVDTESLYTELKDEVNPKNSTEVGTQRLNGKAIMIYSNQLGKTV